MAKRRNPDIVAYWSVPFSDGVRLIEFEHGTTSGKRIIYVNEKEIRREDFMFKLVGVEQFVIGKNHCEIHINAGQGFTYEYTLIVNGKPLQKFMETQTKTLKCWLCSVNGQSYRVMLEKGSLDIYVNGQRQETFGEFTDEGTETHFQIAGHEAFIRNESSGNRRVGIVYTLIVDGKVVPEATLNEL